MKINKLFTLAVTLLLSTVTVVSCGNKTSSSVASTDKTSSQAVESSAQPSETSSTSSSSEATSSQSSSAAVNYGTQDAPLTIAEAKLLCDAAGDNTISSAPLFVKGYVVEITYNSKYSNYEIWISSTSTGEKEFELYACTIEENVVTPIVGSQVIATGYYEKYVGDNSTTYELTHTKIGETRVYPSVVWSDAVKPIIPDAQTIGSLEEPKTVADAYTVIAGLTASTYDESYYSADKYYVKGIVKSVKLKDDAYILDIADSATSTDVLNVYSATLATDVTAPKIGDEVIAIGHLTNYVGKYEMAGDATTYVKPIIEKVTAGTATYAIETSIVDATGATSTNATFTGLPTEAVVANTELSFTVEPTTGYRVSSVSFNGTTLVADAEGNYKVTSYLENKIVVTVVEDVSYAETTATYSIKDIAEENSWEKGTQYSSLPTGDDALSITASKGTNTGKYYTDGNEWRIYQSEGGKITISVSGSHVIKSVTITYTSNKNGVAVYNDTQYKSGATITAGASVSTMEISVGNTGTATNGQVRITNIVVVYA